MAKLEGERREDFPVALRGKRIVLATESLGPINGVSRTTGSLIDYLRAHEVDVAVVAPEINLSGATPSLSATANLRLFGWPLPYNPDLTIAYPFRLSQVFRRTFSPDLIYLASPASVGFQILLQVRQSRDTVPVLCNFQTDLSSYSEIIFPPWVDKYAVWLLGVVQGYLFNTHAVKTVFYPCNDVRRYLETTGVRGEKLVRLGRGVDAALFNPSKRNSAKRTELAPYGEIILICVSRLAPEKGFEFLAKVATRLSAARVSFKLVVVGGNRNPSVQTEIQRYFEPIKDKVVFTGFLSGEPLAQIYAAADIFLHCSITETFGLVVLEAMASGVPVVARDQGGPSEIVRHEKTGYLIPPDDLDLFAKRVRLLCDDRELRTAYADAARQLALDSTWEKINSRAAWYMASALQQHEAATRQDPLTVRRREGKVGAVAFYLQRKLQRIRNRLLQTFALAVISWFWVIACIPLILHGTAAFTAG